MASIDVKIFWDEKISRWENDRYEPDSKSSSLLEWFAKRTSSSLRYRLALAESILTPVVASKHVVEVGCASGRLAGALMGAGAASYTGYDISSEAVQAGNQRVTSEGLMKSVSFHVADIAAMPPLNADIVFSLGVFDWLGDEDIISLFSKSAEADHLHSFSEKRRSLSQWAHRLYVYVTYGHRTNGYAPRYQGADEILRLANANCYKPFHIHRNTKLAFGALLLSLPSHSGS